MDWQTQRAITQLIIGTCCLCFSLSMAVRAKRDGGRRWPLPWRTLVALWILIVGGSYLVHSYYWFTHEGADLGRRVFVWPLWFLSGLSVWVLCRWIRDDPTEPHP